MGPCELTLIVAATNKMGIGRHGTLPWTGLKKEMAYFARVTKRAHGENAVIMGRKTYASIPPQFRPLKSRFNIILSSSASPGLTADSTSSATVPSISAALSLLSGSPPIHRAFIIGGAQVYKTALEMPEAKRILFTRILGDFECDTYFPVELGEDGRTEGWQRKSKEELDGWVGENVPEGVQTENGVSYTFEMWERMEGGGPDGK
ncbi:hypothetical protein B7494_g3950 [Chlorociboria aeruginascens]|nr:hypothetical protein B7494_g3950 [Chlorociboria aeruginascens]